MFRRTLIRLGAAAILVIPAAAHAAELDGATLSWPWALPFAGILLTIAWPLQTGHTQYLAPRSVNAYDGEFAFFEVNLNGL
jgi:hypothetical protein